MRHAALLLVGLTVVGSLAAQGPLPVTPGQRVRLTLDGGRHRVTGLVVSQDSGSVTVQGYFEDSGTVVAQSRITAVELSTARHSNAGAGATVGLLGGAVVGGIIGASCDGDFLCPGAGPTAVAVGIVGLVLGGAIGAFSHSETWQSVYQRRVQVSVVAPARGRGVGFGVAVAF